MKLLRRLLRNCSSFFFLLFSFFLLSSSVFAAVNTSYPTSYIDCATDGASCTNPPKDITKINADDSVDYSSTIWPDNSFHFSGGFWTDNTNPHFIQFNFNPGITGDVVSASVEYDGIFTPADCDGECRFKFLSSTDGFTSIEEVHNQDDLSLSPVLDLSIPPSQLSSLNSLSLRLLAYGNPVDTSYSGFNSLIDYVKLVATIDEDPPSIPILESPIGGAYINDNTPLMQWGDSTDDESDIKNYLYRIYYNCSDPGNVPTSCSSLYPNETGVSRLVSEYQAGPTSDNTFFWQVRAIDETGKESGWSGLEKFTIDTVSPVITNLQVDKTLVMTGDIITIEADIVDTSGIAAVSADFSYDSAYTNRPSPTSVGMTHVSGDTYRVQYTVPASWNDGDVYIKVAARDNTGGNWVRSTEQEIIVVDNTGPIVSLNNPLAGLVRGQVIISGSVIDPHINYYRVIIHNDQGQRVADTGKQFVTINVTSATLHDWDTLPLDDGDYKIILITEDVLANRTTLTRDVVVDNTAPSKPTGLQIIDHLGTFLGCGGFTNDRHITIDWANNPEPDIAYYLLDLKDKDAHKHLTESTYPAHIRDLDGFYKYKIRAVDNIGNISQASDWCGVILDREIPSLPGIPFSLPNPTKSISQNWLWTESTDVGDAGISGYYQNIIDVLGGTASGWSFLGDVLGSTTGLGEGEWKLQVKAEDKAGNQGGYVESDSLIVDTTKPIITWINPSNGNILKAPVLLQAHSDEPLKNLRFKWELLGGVWDSGHNIDQINTDYSWSFTPAADGVYTLRAQGRDLSLNWNKAADIEVTIDNTRPTGKITTPSDGQFLNQNFTVSGWVSDNLSGIEKVKVRLRNHPGNTFRTPWQEATLDSSGNYSTQINIGSIPDDDYEVAVVAYDKAGNDKWLYPRPVITIDTINPIVSITSPSNGDVVSGTTTVTVDANDTTSGIDRVELSYRAVGDTAWIYLDTLTTSPYTYDWNTTGYPLGDYELMAEAFDLAGNSEVDQIEVGVAAVISGEVGITPSYGEIYISWFTDRPTTAQVVYDTVPHPIPDISVFNYGYAFTTGVFDLGKTLFHETLLSGLNDQTVYYYRFISAGSPAAISQEMSNKTFSMAGPGSPPSGGGGAAPLLASTPSVLGTYTYYPTGGANLPDEGEVLGDETKPTPTPEEPTPTPSGSDILGTFTSTSPLYFLGAGLLISLILMLLLFRRK